VPRGGLLHVGVRPAHARVVEAISEEKFYKLDAEDSSGGVVDEFPAAGLGVLHHDDRGSTNADAVQEEHELKRGVGHLAVVFPVPFFYERKKCWTNPELKGSSKEYAPASGVSRS